MMDRYVRQVSVAEIGARGQQAIAAASLLVIGAGGLGCAVLQYLCGAGVGRIVIVDHDRVEETNLHRQPLFRMSDLGRYKAEAARDALLQLNPHVQIQALCERLTPANSAALVANSDIVVDAADSFAVTYMLSDACMAARRVLVSGSVMGVAGYVGAFCAGAASYRAVFPDMPHRAGSCAESGVLGTAVGVVGTVQAHIVLALILGLQPSPLGRMVCIDLSRLRFDGFSFDTAEEPADVLAPFIAESHVTSADVVVDLRSDDEAASSPFRTSLQLSVDEIERLRERLHPTDRVVLCCRSGMRAWRAARKLRAGGHKRLALIALGH